MTLRRQGSWKVLWNYLYVIFFIRQGLSKEEGSCDSRLLLGWGATSQQQWLVYTGMEEHHPHLDGRICKSCSGWVSELESHFLILILSCLFMYLFICFIHDFRYTEKCWDCGFFDNHNFCSPPPTSEVTHRNSYSFLSFQWKFT